MIVFYIEISDLRTIKGKVVDHIIEDVRVDIFTYIIGMLPL